MCHRLACRPLRFVLCAAIRIALNSNLALDRHRAARRVELIGVESRRRLRRHCERV